MFPDQVVDVLDVGGYQPRRIPSKAWRECIKKVWEVDPLACPHCGAEMKIVSFINEAAVIRRILNHLGLWTEVKQVTRPPPAPKAGYDYVDYEPVEDGWAGYKESCIQLS